MDEQQSSATAVQTIKRAQRRPVPFVGGVEQNIIGNLIIQRLATDRVDTEGRPVEHRHHSSIGARSVTRTASVQLFIRSEHLNPAASSPSLCPWPLFPHSIVRDIHRAVQCLPPSLSPSLCIYVVELANVSVYWPPHPIPYSPTTATIHLLLRLLEFQAQRTDRI